MEKIKKVKCMKTNRKADGQIDDLCYGKMDVTKIKNIKHVRSIKKADDGLKTILKEAGIHATDEEIDDLYDMFCYVCGAKFFQELIISPICKCIEQGVFDY